MPDPGMKWQTAAAPLVANPPVVRLLGYFLAGQTSKAQGLLQVGRGRGGGATRGAGEPRCAAPAAARTSAARVAGSAPRGAHGPPLPPYCLQGEEPEDAIWVVLKWDGLAPLALYPSAQQTSGFGLGRLFGAAGGMLDRAKMLRCGGAAAQGPVQRALCSGRVEPRCRGRRGRVQRCGASSVLHSAYSNPPAPPRRAPAGPSRVGRCRRWPSATSRAWCTARWARDPSCCPLLMTAARRGW